MKIQDTSTFRPPSFEKSKQSSLMLWLPVLAIIVFILVIKIMFTQKKVVTTINVVGAGQDLTANTKLGFGHLHYISIPKKFYKDNMFTSTDMVAGKITKNNIRLGEPILKDNLFAEKKSLSHRLQNGLMAYTIKLTDEGILNNSITENDTVNVIYLSSQNENPKAITICQNLKVLSAPEKCLAKDQNSNQDNLLTLQVDENQAQKIALASNNGKIVLTLCSNNSANNIINNIKPISLDDLTTKRISSNVATSNIASKVLIPPPPAIDNISAEFSSIANQNNQAEYTDKWIVEKFSGSEKEEICIPR